MILLIIGYLVWECGKSNFCADIEEPITWGENINIKRDLPSLYTT